MGVYSFVAIWDHTVLKPLMFASLIPLCFVAIWDHTVLKPQIELGTTRA